jgi:cysteine desulfurase
LLEEARERLAGVVGCRPEELVFTSGGSESNACALASAPVGRPLGVGPLEHPSVLQPALQHPQALLLPVDPDGRVRRLPTPSSGSPEFGLLSVALANHETGLIQGLEALTTYARTHATLLHTDASQALGRIPLRFDDREVDLMTLSAHKLGGPVGAGALIVRSGVSLTPLFPGGGQESGRRAGTESVLLAQAFAAAAEAAEAAREDEAARFLRWTRELRRELNELDPTAIFLSPEGERLPNTLCVAFPGRPGSALVQRLDLEGVSVSHGSACASGSLQPSPVLTALGHDESVASSALRISFGHTNVEADAERFLSAMETSLRAIHPRQLKNLSEPRTSD